VFLAVVLFSSDLSLMDFNDKIARIDKNYSDKIKISLSIFILDSWSFVVFKNAADVTMSDAMSNI